MKTLAKSLHTVTAIVRVANHLISTHAVCNTNTVARNVSAVSHALDILGYPYSETLDPYDLTGAALKQLSA